MLHNLSFIATDPRYDTNIEIIQTKEIVTIINGSILLNGYRIYQVGFKELYVHLHVYTT